MAQGDSGRREVIGGMRKSAVFNRIRQAVPTPVVDGVRASARTYGTATSRWRDMPDFLVIGAKKGGTTSVANWLVQHPQVMPMFPRTQRHKSPHYFDINYWRGSQWYLSHFPSRPVRRLHAARSGGALAGETSPYYLFHPAAAGRIRETAPDARLVAVLREPVSRAHSNYFDRVVAGTEDLPTFEDALEAEERRTAGITAEWLSDPHHYSYSHDHHTYLARGRYAEQLRRYFEHFPREQLLVLPLDALRRDAAGSFRRIEDHLGLDHATVDLQARNRRESNPPINPETRERLAAYYAPYNAELAELLGEDFGW